MAFKFNFSADGSDNEDNISISCESKITDVKNIQTAEEVIPDSTKAVDFPTVNYRICNSDIPVVQQQNVQDCNSILSSITSDSDLVPGIYEGGLKIWECGVDLAEYLMKEDVDCHRQSVIELGCGAGLPGIVAMKRGAERVDFQDYNAEVIKNITIPNVQLNRCQQCTCHYYSGDWGSLPSLISNLRYDMILTAETIYSVANYHKLHDAFDKLLTPSGTIYLAAKSHYFGVGGGTRLFEDFLTKQKTFTSTVCFDIQAGVPREILKIIRITS